MDIHYRLAVSKLHFVHECKTHIDESKVEIINDQWYKHYIFLVHINVSIMNIFTCASKSLLRPLSTFIANCRQDPGTVQADDVLAPVTSRQPDSTPLRPEARCRAPPLAVCHHQLPASRPLSALHC